MRRQPRAHRLEFLDALRGVAALAVAFSHRAAGTIDDYQHFDTDVFRAGQFGVVLFFLCSGFIIPASLERYDSLHRFWISRFFRLFPLYWVALSAFLVQRLIARRAARVIVLSEFSRGLLAQLTVVQGRQQR